MSTSPIAAYQDAVSNMKQAIADAERVSNTVSQAAMVLKSWRTAMLSNTKNQSGFPMEIALGRSPTISMSDWPTGDEIERVLFNYHTAKDKLKAAHSNVRAEERAVLKPPETYF